ncbi:hypothetical protein ILP92_04770 [Maribius pontilimi]|uniref:Phytanoyl-CoA dioxygenase (PhyH) n=1 Tax=Palleronia pontilimi TaxID=1964209 RepID=A0A934IF96_9RHOB|nr:hypothetical protein [Palleronia pontilimi]MBJ3762057.1 hypothetical protein [Palleronia pontilimi]
MSDTEDRGWRFFAPDAALRRWGNAALGPAKAALDASGDWRCGGTWCPGVDALPNTVDGAIAGVPLEGAAIRATGWTGPWHRAQLSCCLPGYPLQDADESDAQHRYRIRRDSAHLDGLLPFGPRRRRMLREPHAFVLGIGLAGQGPGAAPLVVWEGSQHILGPALSAVLRRHDPATWSDVDLTDLYQATRREIFDRCTRVEVPLTEGGAVLLHRHLLHGISPWRSDQAAPRTIAYFRPLLDDIADWAA